MILKQLIKYENAPALEATWVEIVEVPQEQDPTHDTYLLPIRQEVVVKCHAYSNGQMDMLRADLGDDAAKHEALIAEVEATYVPPEPEPPYVPTSVTMRQARLALLGAGMLDGVNAAIESMPEPLRSEARIEWEYAAEVHRSAPIVGGIKAASGLTDEQIDALFATAAGM